MNKYYDMNTAAEEAGKDAMPTPCEMFNKMQGLQHDYDMLLMRYTKKCKEHDDIKRALDQTTVRLNDETARADALHRRCEDLVISRQAWVMKCDALTGQLQETMEERERLKELADNYLKEYYKLDGEYDELILHPWRNLWRHIKEALGVG